MAYLLDANIFIEAKNRYYGLDFCPAFWDWLVNGNAAGKIFSIDRVEAELRAGRDELKGWASKRGSRFFLSSDAGRAKALPTVATWAASAGYEPAALAKFLQGTDYELVSHALAHAHTVVTHELPSVGLKQVKIPNACSSHKVTVISPWQMLRKEGARFVLGT